MPVLGPELRRLWPIARPDSQETDTAPDSVVTPTSRSSRLGKRRCERVKSTPRHPSPVAVLCSATIVIINGASGLFMAKRDLPSTLGFSAPARGPGTGPATGAGARQHEPVRDGLGFTSSGFTSSGFTSSGFTSLGLGPQSRGVAIRGVQCEIYAKWRKLLHKRFILFFGSARLSQSLTGASKHCHKQCGAVWRIGRCSALRAGPSIVSIDSGCDPR